MSDPESVAARLAFVVGRFNRRLIAATGGLSHGLLSALSTIAKQGPIRLADLAQVELVSAPSITRLVPIASDSRTAPIAAGHRHRVPAASTSASVRKKIIELVA